MTIVTVCNHKGGTGKTTSVIQLAAALGLSGHRVLAIDLDPQSFLTRTLGVSEPSETTSSAALFDPHSVLDDIKMLPMKGFDLLPASTALTKLMRRLNKPTDVFWAKETIERLTGYDIVLFDTAAAVTVYSINALVASDFILIPVTPEHQPVIGAEQTYQTALMVRARLNPSLAEPLFLFTRVDGRKRDHYQYRHYFRKNYKDRVMDSVIRTSTSLTVAYNDGSTVFQNDPSSRGALDYANACDELLKHLASTKKNDASPLVQPIQQTEGGLAMPDS